MVMLMAGVLHASLYQTRGDGIVGVAPPLPHLMHKYAMALARAIEYVAYGGTNLLMVHGGVLLHDGILYVCKDPETLDPHAFMVARLSPPLTAYCDAVVDVLLRKTDAQYTPCDMHGEPIAAVPPLYSVLHVAYRAPAFAKEDRWQLRRAALVHLYVGDGIFFQGTRDSVRITAEHVRAALKESGSKRARTSPEAIDDAAAASLCSPRARAPGERRHYNAVVHKMRCAVNSPAHRCAVLRALRAGGTHVYAETWCERSPLYMLAQELFMRDGAVDMSLPPNTDARGAVAHLVLQTLLAVPARERDDLWLLCLLELVLEDLALNESQGVLVLPVARITELAHDYLEIPSFARVVERCVELLQTCDTIVRVDGGEGVCRRSVALDYRALCAELLRWNTAGPSAHVNVVMENDTEQPDDLVRAVAARADIARVMVYVPHDVVWEDWLRRFGGIGARWRGPSSDKDTALPGGALGAADLLIIPHCDAMPPRALRAALAFATPEGDALPHLILLGDARMPWPAHALRASAGASLNRAADIGAYWRAALPDTAANPMPLLRDFFAFANGGRPAFTPAPVRAQVLARALMAESLRCATEQVVSQCVKVGPIEVRVSTYDAWAAAVADKNSARARAYHVPSVWTPARRDPLVCVPAAHYGTVACAMSACVGRAVLGGHVSSPATDAHFVRGWACSLDALWPVGDASTDTALIAMTGGGTVRVIVDAPSGILAPVLHTSKQAEKTAIVVHAGVRAQQQPDKEAIPKGRVKFDCVSECLPTIGSRVLFPLGASGMPPSVDDLTVLLDESSAPSIKYTLRGVEAALLRQRTGALLLIVPREAPDLLLEAARLLCGAKSVDEAAQLATDDSVWEDVGLHSSLPREF